MKRRFADLATRYYIRTADNRVFFPNGESQDQMAHTLSQGGTVKYEPATLSRILNGKRLPTPEQYASFVKILSIPADEEEELRLALMMDYADRSGFGVALSSTVAVTNLLVNNIDLLRTAIDDGDFDNALRLLKQIGETRQQLEVADGVTAPLLRIAVMSELEREMLLSLLADRADEFEIALTLPDDEEEKDRIEAAIEASTLSEKAKEVARWRYLEERDVEAIADRVEMTDEATLAWLDEIHGVLLQRLARDPE